MVDEQLLFVHELNGNVVQIIDRKLVVISLLLQVGRSRFSQTLRNTRMPLLPLVF